MKRRYSTQLGSGGLVYVVVAGMILGAAIYTQANLLFWSFGLMIGGLLASIVVSWFMLRGMEVRRLLPAHGVVDELMVLRYRLVNHKRWLPAFNLVIYETWGRGWRGWRRVGPIAQRPQRLRARPHGWVMHIGPKQTAQAEAPCWPARRGLLEFDRIVVGLSFPFGVIRRTMTVSQPGRVVVYPRLYRIKRRLLHRVSQWDPVGSQHLERAGGYEDFFGLRPYRHGDNLKVIDWKHSARTGALISREMTQPSPPRIMLALDLTRPPVADQPSSGDQEAQSAGYLEQVEQAVSLAASVICDAHFHGYQVGMIVPGVPDAVFPIHHSLPHRTRILETLAVLQPPQDTGAAAGWIPAEPSVVVTLRAGGGSSMGRAVLSVHRMQEYVTAVEGGPGKLLERGEDRRRRRQQIKGDALWA